MISTNLPSILVPIITLFLPGVAMIALFFFIEKEV